MAKPLDLDAYLGRINYTGPRTPTYDALTGILQAHIASIPFESFDVLLGRPIRLDSEGLQAKIVTARRGGYCFEHASLMYAALERIGFAPVRHASRVLLQRFLGPNHNDGRVEVWRGGGRKNLSVPAPFGWRCLTSSAIAPFPHPAHRTGHADFPHPALGQDFTPLPTARRAQAGTSVRA
jgi:arylamine N-acetyltransferase